MDRQLLDMLLSLFLTTALSLVVFTALFSYSFKRRSHFLLRAFLCLVFVGGISVALSFSLYFAFMNGMEENLANLEWIRILSNTLSIAISSCVIHICFDEKVSLVLYATIMGNALHCLSINLYEAIIAALRINSIFFTMYTGYDILSFLLFYGMYITVFLIAYFTCAKPFARMSKSFEKKIGRSILGLFVISTYVMAGLQGSNVFNPLFNGATEDAVRYVFFGFMAVWDVTVIFMMRFILVWAYTSQEKEAEEAFFEAYREKVELQERNMELINLKCHDMKHQLRTMLEGKNLDPAFIEETQRTISIFDAQVKTGNDTLDTLLTQESLICEANHIQMTAMLDGSELAFMSVQDVNSFFGNALDNAVEYLLGVEEDRRFIRITSSRQGDLLSIRVENYCDAEVQFDKKAFPLSTKEKNGFHGFGTKSMCAVAEKYGGTVSFDREGDLFIVTALFVNGTQKGG